MKDIGSAHAVFDCPNCGVKGCLHTRRIHEGGKGASRQVKDEADTTYGVQLDRFHSVYTCVSCSGDTYVLYQRWGEVTGHLKQGDPQITVLQHGQEVVHQWPVATSATDPSIPADVADAADEAEKCLAVGAYNACGTMVRRAVDAFTLEKKGSGKDVFERLADLKARNVITPDLWEWAEELRTAGKVGAHPEWEAMNSAEAEYAVRFLREILRFVYINPSERQERRLKETKKKG